MRKAQNVRFTVQTMCKLSMSIFDENCLIFPNHNSTCDLSLTSIPNRPKRMDNSKCIGVKRTIADLFLGTKIKSQSYSILEM